MTTNAVWIKVDPDHVVETLQKEAVERLNGPEGELVLDFSAVRCIDAGAVKALEALAGLAEHRSVKIALRGVNVDIYKVLKLVKLTGRFLLLS